MVSQCSLCLVLRRLDEHTLEQLMPLHVACRTLHGVLCWLACSCVMPPAAASICICSVDAWSVGVLGYELVAGFPPFSMGDQKDVSLGCLPRGFKTMHLQMSVMQCDATVCVLGSTQRVQQANFATGYRRSVACYAFCIKPNVCSISYLFHAGLL